MKRIRTDFPTTRPRGGTTLTEVLMAILCMGIGVVAVASLFPIALLRSVQATQLTSATILRFNAETLIDIDPRIALNPNPNSTSLDSYIQPAATTNSYLVDPLGWVIADADGRTTDQIGNLRRWNLGLDTEPAAENFVTLPDSWVTLHDAFPVSNTSDSVTLPNPVPQDVFNTFDAFDTNGSGILNANEAPGEVLRVVLFNFDGRLSEVRYIRDRTQMAGATINWPPPNPPLPDNGQYFDDNVSRVRIEVRERRFTWLLTVRNYQIDERDDLNQPLAASANVDVVVFFRRSPSLEDETLYTLSGNLRNYVVNKSDPNDPNPFLKKGGYMLDTRNGKWHRLAQADGDAQTITLERNVTGSLNNHQVVFMRGVVEVYELGKKHIQVPQPTP